MAIERIPSPFKIGDRVEFAPNEHAYGWTCHSFERLKLKPGDIGFITRIEGEVYIFLDDDRGGLHWECFKGV
jgi:ATP-dependent exoDNAse (exonuclease V) alpha subunit